MCSDIRLLLFGCRVSHQRCVDVDPALELVRPGPPAGALLLVRRRRSGAGDAPDRAVAGLVQRVVGNLVDLDVRPNALLVPVGERVELPDAVALRPLKLRRRRAARRLVAADAGDPALVRAERLEQRLDLTDVATAIGVRLPQVRALAPVLLGDGDHTRAQELEAGTVGAPGAPVAGPTPAEL